ncbi:MAG: hypothetical protein QF752_13295 [Planctomycetota bacterium]|jgi:hypothetical protein|nr:hypothetical protein [Planctomycetota bacterium]
MKRILGIGCLTVLLVGALMVVLGVQRLPEMMDWVLETVEEETNFSKLAEEWIPPEQEGVESLFPSEVGEFILVSGAGVEGIPGMGNVDEPRRRYGAESGTIIFQIGRASRLEGEALLTRIRRAYEDQSGGGKSFLEVGSRLECDSSPLGATLGWWIQGWMLVVHTRDSADLRAFMSAYLTEKTD